MSATTRSEELYANFIAENTVTITGPFDPNRFEKKLCCYAGKAIKSIEIKEPEKPKPPPSNPEPAKPSPPPKAPEQAPKAPDPAPKAPEPAPVPNIFVPIYVQGFPTPYPTPYPVPMWPCYEGYAKPPLYNFYRRQHCYCGCEDRYTRSSCCEYINEDNPTTCTIM
ncbi:hypothetical protein GIB67_000981 [Kingdonia uniflora]|uniref:Uncharacterized protein n=1 Tax=Kingdonia uniflora TaxID=39325 RepID=A0A7J7MG95_9MAGN|nr:hypothetical protein GIB67_000981 [Kingdonia uniflora]